MGAQCSTCLSSCLGTATSLMSSSSAPESAGYAPVGASGPGDVAMASIAVVQPPVQHASDQATSAHKSSDVPIDVEEFDDDEFDKWGHSDDEDNHDVEAQSKRQASPQRQPSPPSSTKPSTIAPLPSSLHSGASTPVPLISPPPAATPEARLAAAAAIKPPPTITSHSAAVALAEQDLFSSMGLNTTYVEPVRAAPKLHAVKTVTPATSNHTIAGLSPTAANTAQPRSSGKFDLDYLNASTTSDATGASSWDDDGGEVMAVHAPVDVGLAAEIQRDLDIDLAELGIEMERESPPTSARAIQDKANGRDASGKKKAALAVAAAPLSDDDDADIDIDLDAM